MKAVKIKLSNSLRKHIRKNKEEIRKNFGPASPQEEELIRKVQELKKQKLARHK